MAEPNPTRLPALDLLRFAAAVAVTLYHYVTCYPVPADASLAPVRAVSAVTRYGYLGVDLFFMISGFVILWSSMNRDALGFTISRISRLYPTFWVSMAFTVLCIVTLGGAIAGYESPPLDARTVLANVTMLPTMLGATRIEDVYWTLEIEIRFYAIIFVLLVLRQMRNVELWLYAWLALSIVGLFVELPRVIHFLALQPYGPFFIAGCLFYRVLAAGLNWQRGVALAIAAACCVYVAIPQRSQFVTPDAISAWVVPTIVLAFFGAFAMLVLRPGQSRLPRFAYQLGELTYPLYLTHATMGILVYQILRPRIGVGLALAAITVLSIVIAWVITQAVDRPARKPFSNLLFRWAAALRLYKPPAGEPAK
jgi:peptidoglycan/LPS O-acetylase OafA/YrhL